MNPAEHGVEFAHHLAEWQSESGSPSDQHIVMAGPQPTTPGGFGTFRSRRRGRQSHDFPQSAAHAVTLHGVAHLSRHGETDADRPFIGATPRLQDEATCRCPHAARRGAKIAPESQALHGNDWAGDRLTH